MNIKSDLKKLGLFLKENISTATSLIGIITGIVALYISILSYNNANDQFEKNSVSSDSLFNVQLHNERQLNDSLIKQIRTLQKITNNQLEIIDEQLKISTQSYNEQLNSGRPKIVINSKTFRLLNVSSSQIHNGIIETKIENIGYRPAFKLNTRGFVVYKDLSFVIKNIDKDEGILDPSKDRIINLYPQLNSENIQDFYYCIEISYHDRLLKKPFIQSYYYHYQTLKDELRFYNCTPEEKQEIKIRINKLLIDMNINPLVN